MSADSERLAGQLAIAVDNIVRPERTRQMMLIFIAILMMSNSLSFRKCSRCLGCTFRRARGTGDWRNTRIPVGGRYAFRDMGMLSWSCVLPATTRWR